MPQIQFIRMDTGVQRGRANGIEVHGNGMKDNQPWTKFIPSFDPAYELVKSACEGFMEGQIIDMKMQKNDKGFWSVVDVVPFGQRAAEGPATQPQSAPSTAAPVPNAASSAQTVAPSGVLIPNGVVENQALDYAVRIMVGMLETGIGVKKTLTNDMLADQTIGMAAQFTKFISGDLAEDVATSAVSDIDPADLNIEAGSDDTMV